MEKIWDNEIAQMCGSKYKNIKNPENKTGEVEDYWGWTEPAMGFPQDQAAAWQIGNFKFGTSWEWLMFAVKSAESKGFMVEIYRDHCGIVGPINERTVETGDFEYQHLEKNGEKIEVVYRAIAKFSQWYNLKNL